MFTGSLISVWTISRFSMRHATLTWYALAPSYVYRVQTCSLSIRWLSRTASSVVPSSDMCSSQLSRWTPSFWKMLLGVVRVLSLTPASYLYIVCCIYRISQSSQAIITRLGPCSNQYCLRFCPQQHFAHGASTTCSEPALRH
jgi:hypothetical protein